MALGFYGKLPAHGDFIERGFSGAGIRGWDDWLQRALAISREQLGERWLDIYLTSPPEKNAAYQEVLKAQAAFELHVGDVMDFPRVTGNSKHRCDWHPTQLHPEMIERLVKFCSKETGRVLDPFAGTGTTAKVCDRIGRSCTTVDVDRTYCEKIAADLDLKPVSLECWAR